MQFYIAKSYKNKYEQQERALQNKGGVVLTPWPPPLPNPWLRVPRSYLNSLNHHFPFVIRIHQDYSY